MLNSAPYSNEAHEKVCAVYYNCPKANNVVKIPIAVQGKAIIRHCGFFNKHIAREFVDHSADGGRDMYYRDGMQLLLDDVHNGRITEVIVSKMSVVSFDINDVFAFARHLKKYGVGFISVHENFDTSTFLGSYMLELWGGASDEIRDSAVDHAKQELLTYRMSIKNEAVSKAS